MVKGKTARVVVCVALVVGLAAPALALAAAPTPAQEKAITEAAVDYEQGSAQQTVGVTGIDVSEDGRWAQVDVSVYMDGSLEYSKTGVFRNDGGTWQHSGHQAPAGSFDDSGSSSGSKWIWVLLIAVWVIALCGLIDVAQHSKRAFAAAERSKRMWVILQTVGFLGPSLIIVPYYLFAVRPKVVEGARRVSSEDFQQTLERIRTSPAPSPGPTWPQNKEQPKVLVPDMPKASPAAPPPAKRRARRAETPAPPPKCSTCQGLKTVQCTVCHGRGELPRIPPIPGVPPMQTCWNCGHRGRVTCPGCRGSGTA